MILFQEGGLDDVYENIKEIKMEEECDGDIHHGGICCLMALCQGDVGDGGVQGSCACHFGDGRHKI